MTLSNLAARIAIMETPGPIIEFLTETVSGALRLVKMTCTIAVMANTPIEIGPVGRQVAAGVAAIRDERGLKQQELAVRVTAAGRPITASAVSKIEKLDRRVDVDDLVSLAIALGVNPSRLLMPGRADDTPLALTPTVTVSAWQAWQWVDGRYPLPTRPPGNTDEFNTAEEYADFQAFARPKDLGVREQHTAVRAAQDVANRLMRLLSAADGHGIAARRTAVRRAVDRLMAEVSDLLEDAHDGR